MSAPHDQEGPGSAWRAAAEVTGVKTAHTLPAAGVASCRALGDMAPHSSSGWSLLSPSLLGDSPSSRPIRDLPTGFWGCCQASAQKPGDTRTRPCSLLFALCHVCCLLKVLDSVVVSFAAPGGGSVLTAGGWGTMTAQRSLAGLAVHGGHKQPCFYRSPDSSSHEMSRGLCGFQLSDRITNPPQQWGFHSS